MRKNILFILSLALPLISVAQATTAAQPVNSFPTWLNSEFIMITLAMLFILFLIIVLGNTGIHLSKAAAKVGKKSSATILLLLATATAFAQATTEAPAQVESNFPQWALNLNVYVLGVLFFIMAFAVYALYRANIYLLRYIHPQEETEEAVRAAAKAEANPHLLRRWHKKLAGGVPLAEEKDILLDHDYDGIKELDNKLPPWWIYGFYITIVFAVIYLFNYHIFKTGKLSHDEYKAELVQAEKQKEERMKANANYVNEENVATLAEAGELAKGKETFVKFCSPCHRPDGGGQVGPNLTDEYWLHGGGIKNVFKTITYGVPAKGMLSWKAQLSPKQIQEVSSYILTLKGTNPPGAKEPQGDVWVEETAPAQNVDSTKSTHAAAAILLTR
jgi:cytochrome c oxidase cbb3-type subunit III